MYALVRRALAARRLRTALSIVAVGLGVTVMVGVSIGTAGLNQQASSAEAMRAGQSGLDVRATANGGLSTQQLEAIGRIPGVAEVVPLYEKRVIARAQQPKGAAPGQPVTVSLVGLRDGAVALRPLSVVAGRLPAPGTHDEVAVDVHLSTSLARAGHQLAVGDSIVLTTVTGDDVFRVVGLTDQPTVSETFTKDAVAVPDTTLRNAFGLGLRSPLAALRLAPGSSTEAVAGAVHGALGSDVTTFSPAAGAAQPLRQVTPLLLLVTALAILIGAAVSANSISLSTWERRRDIGLLRAAGASGRQVFRLFVAEAAVVAVAGTVVGVAAGILAGWLLVRTFANPALPLPPLSLDPALTLAIAGLGLVTAVLGASIPAVIAARTGILASLRPDTASRTATMPVVLRAAIAPLLAIAAVSAAGSGPWVVVSGFCLLAGIGLALPMIVGPAARVIALILRPVWPRSDLAAAALRRRRNRTAMAIAGLVTAIAASVASSILVAGSLQASDGWVGHLFVGDTVIRSPVTQRDAVAVALGNDAGVSVTPLRFFPATVDGDVIGITALDADTYDQNGGLDLGGSERHHVFGDLGSGPRVLVPEDLAAATGWGPGTALHVTTASGPHTFTVEAVVAHSFPGGDGRESLVMAAAQARTYFPAEGPGFDDLEVLTPGRGGTVAAVAARYGMSSVAVSDIVEASRSAVDRAVGLLLGVAVIAVVIGVLSVVNTVAVSIRQSTRELGLLRAVGLSRGEALRLLIGEAGLIAVIAAIVGVAVGLLLAVPMLRAGASPGFTPGFVVPAPLLIAILVAVVLASTVSALVPARRAAGASIVAAVQHE
jgi:putative ABC transport system permease protein